MTKLRISDHAVLRYLERVGGFNMDALRAEIEQRVSKIYLPGAPAVVLDGFRYVISDDGRGPVVTTILKRAVKPCVDQSRGGK